ncbi:MAG: ribosome-associated translation inhibitor RaiA [Planctomycetota bacterium]
MKNVKITARHLKITDEIKDYIHSKLDSLDRYFNRIKHIEVILDHNREQFVIEAVVSVIRGRKLVSKISDYNYILAVNRTVDKIEKQLVKMKEKIKQTYYPSPLSESGNELKQDDWY